MSKRNGERGSKAEFDRRVSAVYNMILQGATRRQILQNASKNGWGVSDRSVDEYISSAMKEIGDVAGEEKAAALGSALKRLNIMLNMALKKDDLKTALAIQKEINDLYHLKDTDSNAPSTVNITFTHGEERFL